MGASCGEEDSIRLGSGRGRAIAAKATQGLSRFVIPGPIGNHVETRDAGENRRSPGDGPSPGRGRAGRLMGRMFPKSESG